MNGRIAICIAGASALVLVACLLWVSSGEMPWVPPGEANASTRDASGSAREGDAATTQPHDGTSDKRVEVVPAPPQEREKEPRKETDRLRLDELPDDLRAKAERAVRACRFSREKLGGAWPHGEPMLTISGARRIVAAEDALKAEILAHARVLERVLVARLEADPTGGIRVNRKEIKSLDEKLRKDYPGWPEGYQYASIGDGRTTHIAAWRVKGDEELEALKQYGASLGGDYARAIRAGYIRELDFR